MAKTEPRKPKRKPANRRRGCLVLLILVAACGVLPLVSQYNEASRGAFATRAVTDVPAAEDRATNTEIPTVPPTLPANPADEENALENAIANLPGVTGVEFVLVTRGVNAPDRPDVQVQIAVRQGQDTLLMADAILDSAKDVLSAEAFMQFIVQLDDGETMTDYTLHPVRGEWEITPVRGAGNVQNLVMATNTPAATIRVTVTPAGQVARPANCATAVAMGLSAAEAAQWDHLDRDGDGVACYGD